MVDVKIYCSYFSRKIRQEKFNYFNHTLKIEYTLKIEIKGYDHKICTLRKELQF